MDLHGEERGERGEAEAGETFAEKWRDSLTECDGGL
jgi:hypothetical protein